MDSPYTSKYFYHFVGFNKTLDHESNYSTLLKILDDGAVTHKPHILNTPLRIVSFNWNANIEKGELIVPEVTCYCDIPFDVLGIHIKKYGSFGVSFPHSFLVRNAARPVIYIPKQPSAPNAGLGKSHGLTMLSRWLRLRASFDEHFVKPITKLEPYDGTIDPYPDNPDKKPISQSKIYDTTIESELDNPDNTIRAVDQFLGYDFFAFLKVFNSDLAEDASENFYLEREWRMHGNLRFSYDDVAEVIVDRKYITRLKNDMPKYASKVRPPP